MNDAHKQTLHLVTRTSEDHKHVYNDTRMQILLIWALSKDQTGKPSNWQSRHKCLAFNMHVTYHWNNSVFEF
jgi:hypothetical protein